jgi:dihydroneopterin aldolase/2-amino-4-hydroxy-6-hydroxymethyldihydropteridine diphosphokinase
MSVDRIALTGLRVTGHHGVLPQELRDGQEFIIDAVLGVATAAAAAADDLSLTADYGQLADELAAIGSGEPVALIETLAGRLAAACLAHPAVQEAEITVHKPHAPVSQPLDDVTVTISRSRVVLALGSNLGDRLANLQGGLDVLGAAPGLHWLAVSPVYETVPAGGPAQGDYLNAVVIAMSSLPARAVLAYAHEAEAALGRTRAERWGPRTLDVDLIVSGGQIGGEPELTLPHPRAHERAFVLAPWLDVAPGAQIPGRGRVAALLAAAGRGGLRRLPDISLQLPDSSQQLPDSSQQLPAGRPRPRA